MSRQPPKAIPEDDLNFDLFWEADNWETTHQDTMTLEDDLEHGESFNVVRIGVARRARDIFAVWWYDVKETKHFSYFECEEDAIEFSRIRKAAWAAATTESDGD